MIDIHKIRCYNYYIMVSKLRYHSFYLAFMELPVTKQIKGLQKRTPQCRM